MKLIHEEKNTKTNISVDDTITLSISENLEDQASLMNILMSKLYSDPVFSACKEIICNALDANKEAGNEHIPIKITLPNIENEYTFAVEDSGIGISPQRMLDIYTKFGASSKRDNNNQQGGFGLGAKSVLCITDCATIETTFEDTTYYYSFYLNDKNIPTVSLLHKVSKGSPSGTKITVKGSTNTERRDLSTEIATIIRFVTPRPILINADSRLVESLSSPKKYWKPDDIDNILFSMKPRHSSIYVRILIDNIPYTFRTEKGRAILRTNTDHYLTCQWTSIGYEEDGDIILQFKTGELSIAATRESVTTNDKNLLIIQERVKEVHEYLTLKRARLKQTKTVFEYLDIHPPFNISNIDDLYKGISLPLTEGGRLLNFTPSGQQSKCQEAENPTIPGVFKTTEKSLTIYHSFNGELTLQNTVNSRELLTTPTYVVKYDQKTGRAQSIEYTDLPEEYYLLVYQTFKSDIHKAMCGLWKYPPKFYTVRKKKETVPPTFTIETAVKSKLLRVIHKEDAQDLTGYVSDSRYYSLMKTVETVPEEETLFYIDSRDSEQRTYLPSFLKDSGFDKVYITTPRIEEAFKDKGITIRDYLENLKRDLYVKYDKWLYTAIRMIIREEELLSMAGYLARVVDNKEAQAVLESELFSQRTLNLLSIRHDLELCKELYTSIFDEQQLKIIDSSRHGTHVKCALLYLTLAPKVKKEKMELVFRILVDSNINADNMDAWRDILSNFILS